MGKGASVSVNGKVQDINAQPGEYLTVRRKWKAGDEITLNLPMQVTLEQIPDQEHFYAFMYGPIVLASPTGTETWTGSMPMTVVAGTSLMASWSLWKDADVDRLFHIIASSTSENG